MVYVCDMCSVCVVWCVYLCGVFIVCVVCMWGLCVLEEEGNSFSTSLNNPVYKLCSLVPDSFFSRLCFLL